MPIRDLWWRRHFEGMADGKRKCRTCGEAGDARGGWPGRHLELVHGIREGEEPPEPAEPPVATPAAPAGPSPPATDLSLEANLAALLKDATDSGAPLHARVMARKAIMEALGQFDAPPEEDIKELRRKWMAMHEEALSDIGKARAMLREEMSDPVKRGEMRQILAEAEGIKA